MAPLPLVLATFFFVFPADAVKGTCSVTRSVTCSMCEDRACYKRRFEKQKALTAEANNKCGDGGGNNEDWKAKYDALKLEHDALKAQLTTTTTTSAAGVDPQCFMDGGDCASCCGACVKTTDLDNRATTDSCVCYEASTAPSGPFYGTDNDDCVFIDADDVEKIFVRNQCLEGAEAVLAPPRRGS